MTSLTPQQVADYALEERAAILEYDAHLSRIEAEQAARRMEAERVRVEAEWRKGQLPLGAK